MVQVLHGAAGRRDLRGVVGRQVRADLLPVVALVERPEEHLRARVDDAAVERRERERRRPVPPERRLAGRPRRHDRLARAGLLVVPIVPAPLDRVVDPPAVGRVHAVVHPVVVAHRHPVLGAHATRRSVDRPAPRVVILEASVDPIRILHVDGDRVELAARDVGVVVARLAGVVGDLDTAVAPENPAVGVLRVDPHRAEVAEPAGEQVARVPVQAGPRLAAIVGTQERVAVDDDPLVVVRIDADLIEGIPRLRAHVAGGRVHLPPGLPAVVGPVDLAADVARLRFDLARAVARGLVLGRRPFPEVLGDRVEDVRVLLVDVEADPALRRRRQAAGEFRPRLPAVGGLVDAAGDAVLEQLPRPALHVVHRRVKRVGLSPVDDQIDRAGLVVDVEHLRPGLPSITCLEHAAFLAGRPQASHRRDVDNVGIGRVDDDAADLPGFLQPHPLPRLAGVGRLVDAVARVRDADARGVPGADPHDVLVRRRDGQAADAGHVLSVEDGLKGRAVVGRLPDAAVADRDVEGVEVRFQRRLRHRDVRDPGPCAIRSEGAVAEARELVLGEGGRRGRRRLREQRAARRQQESA